MYNAEVLSKFPVVQHFPFGSLFAWETDPNAKTIEASVHTSSQPKASTPSSTAPTARPQPPLRDPLADVSSKSTRAPSGMPATAAPWARATPQVPGGSNETTRAPWAAGRSAPPVPSGPNQPTRAPWLSSTPAPPLPRSGNTAAPWANARGALGAGNAAAVQDTTQENQQSTRAPWADKKP